MFKHIGFVIAGLFLISTPVVMLGAQPEEGMESIQKIQFGDTQKKVYRTVDSDSLITTINPQGMGAKVSSSPRFAKQNPAGPNSIFLLSMGEEEFELEFEFCRDRLCKIRLFGTSFGADRFESEVRSERDWLVRVVRQFYGKPTQLQKKVAPGSILPKYPTWTHEWGTPESDSNTVRLGYTYDFNMMDENYEAQDEKGYYVILTIENPDFARMKGSY